MNGINNNCNGTCNNLQSNYPGTSQDCAHSAQNGCQGTIAQNNEVIQLVNTQLSGYWQQYSQFYNYVTKTFQKIFNDINKLNMDMYKVSSQAEDIRKRVENLEKSLSYLNISQMHNKNTMQSAPVNPWHQPNTAQCRNDNFVSDAKTERDFRDFTDKICEISILEPSFNRRSVLKKFFAQWHIERFICSNESAKQADPNIDPEFMTDEEKGYYWAVPLDKPGFYMVYPDPSLSYEQSRHSSKGYKEVFDTGYESGAYNFEPEKPAVFYKQGKQWIFKIKGKLRLERT